MTKEEAKNTKSKALLLYSMAMLNPLHMGNREETDTNNYTQKSKNKKRIKKNRKAKKIAMLKGNVYSKKIKRIRNRKKRKGRC